MSEAVTISLAADLAALLDGAAAELNLSRDAVLRSALSSFLEADALVGEPLQDWQEERTRRGLADAEAGRFVSSETLARIAAKFD